MSSSTVSANNKAKAAKSAPGLPEERFWKRYSPHHEFSLSTVASVVLHGLGFGLIVLAAVLMARIGFDDKPPEVDALELEGGGGGNVAGVGSGANTEVLPRNERVADETTPPTSPVKPVEPLQPTKVIPPDLKVENSDDRTIDIDASAVVNQLSDIGKRAREDIEKAIAGKGKGGPGRGGGEGSGAGTGTGDKIGPGTGKGGQLTQRQKRQLRWVMMFNTLNGNDYANQLRGLGAILAIPQGNGEFYVIRDLGRRPATGKVEDISGLDRIFWIDDKPQSVFSLTSALGISPPPSHVAAFFPQELEAELLKKELAYYHKMHSRGSEDDIRETRFQVRPIGGGKYEPIVVTQTAR